MAEATVSSPVRRATVGLWVRIGASALMLALLVPRIDVTALLPAGHHVSTVRWVVVGLGLTLFGFVLSAWRWQRVLTVFDQRVRLGSLVSHYLAGQFVGNFLPSTIGGDVLRITRLTPSVRSPATSFASVVLERLTGWLVLPLLTLLGLLLHPSLFTLGFAPKLALGLALSTLALLALVLTAAGSRHLGGRFNEHDGWRKFLGAVHEGVDSLRHRPRRALGVMTAAGVYQLSMVSTVWIATQAVGLHLSVLAVVAFAPVVLIAQVLPFSLNGIGLREGAFVLFLTPLGVSTTQAVAVGLLVYAMTLVVSLLGAPAFAVGSRATRLETASA